MKTKGIPFWEQHLEHIVLGVVAVVCLALLAMQFIGEPNAVQVAGKTISPGQIDAELRSRAEEVRGRLESTASVDFGDTAEPVMPRLKEQMESPVTPSGVLALHQPRLPLGKGDIIQSRPFRVARIPAPSTLQVQENVDTIEAAVVDENADLQSLLAMAAPYDIVWNTPSAEFNIESVLQQWSQPGEDNSAPLPISWTAGVVNFIDVRVEREEYIDGAWTDHRLLEPMPGMFSFRMQLKDKAVDDALRNSVLAEAADPAIRSQIIQPAFYDTLNDSWTPPGEEAEGASVAIAVDDPAAEFKEALAQTQKALDLVNKQLKEKDCPETPPAKEESPTKTSSPDRGGGGGGAAAPGTGIGGDSQGTAAGGLRSGAGQINAACERLWRRKEKLLKTVADLEAKIAEIQGKQAAEPVVVEAAPEEPEKIVRIWAHDLGVKPGKTYRYRFTVEIYNPLFGRKLSLIPEQQPLAEQFTLASEASEWSEPMTVQPMLRAFVTQARSSSTTGLGSLAMGSATAEVYRFSNGRWWFERFTLQPGDRVGDPKASRDGAQVDYSTDWFVLDVTEALGADRTETERNWAAAVMLQSLSDPSRIEWRSPRDEWNSAERRRLAARVKIAELGGPEGTADATPVAGN